MEMDAPPTWGPCGDGEAAPVSPSCCWCAGYHGVQQEDGPAVVEDEDHQEAAAAAVAAHCDQQGFATAAVVKA